MFTQLKRKKEQPKTITTEHSINLRSNPSKLAVVNKLLIHSDLQSFYRRRALDQW